MRAPFRFPAPRATRRARHHTICDPAPARYTSPRCACPAVPLYCMIVSSNPNNALVAAVASRAANTPDFLQVARKCSAIAVQLAAWRRAYAHRPSAMSGSISSQPVARSNHQPERQLRKRRTLLISSVRSDTSSTHRCFRARALRYSRLTATDSQSSVSVLEE